jgi:uncharacterized protein YaiE (UPF0345 family)
MTDRINADISTRANIFFDGKCISHSIETPDGAWKTVGVILPSTLKFNTSRPEVMELVEGDCRVRLAGSNDWIRYQGGESFKVPGATSFEIEVTTALHYICHFD